MMSNGRGDKDGAAFPGTELWIRADPETRRTATQGLISSSSEMVVDPAASRWNTATNWTGGQAVTRRNNLNRKQIEAGLALFWKDLII